MPNPIAPVPPARIRLVADHPPQADARYVLYWMIASRRVEDNFALQQAAWWAAALGLPLVVFEAVRCDYPWASDRLHAFLLQGMADNAAACRAAGVRYVAYVEPTPGHGRGLLAALAAAAAVVVTDDFPAFFLPRMVAAAGASLSRRLEAVDSNGLLPMRATDTVFPTAYAFRRYLQKTLPGHLDAVPVRAPLAALPRALAALPQGVSTTWPPASEALLRAEAEALRALPVDHGVAPSAIRGGAAAAHTRLANYLATDLDRYHEDRNHPDRDASSGLSPYLHFGHISAHRVFAEVMTREGWTRRQLSAKATGQRSGWWNVSVQAEAFLDQCLTWREVGYNFCALREDYDRYESLPAWARASLDAHASDPREHLYSLDAFEQARTHDAVWNAAQRQLLREGRMHNYLRMLWGKKILEWSATPQDALRVMIDLNNRYALDGRDPNSYSGIFWILGRYDRPWAPRRPVYGVIRYMSSANTIRKLSMKRYLETYGDDGRQPLLQLR
jgi:deoxyribodipyrimidine photo-lyase